MSTPLVVFFTVLLEVSIGMAQNPILTEGAYNCAARSVQYNCTVNSAVVQWIAEPFIPAIGTPLVIDSSIGGNADIMGANGEVIITVRQICEEPFLTTMMISVDILDTVTLTCMDIATGIGASADYIPGVLSRVKPRSELRLQQLAMNSNPTVEMILVETDDNDATRSFVNCSDNMCNEETFDGNETVIMADCDTGSVSVTVGVYSVNECGELSDRNSRDIDLECLNSGSFLTTVEIVADDDDDIPLWALIICIIVIVLSLIVIGILVAYIACSKAKHREKSPLEAPKRELHAKTSF